MSRPSSGKRASAASRDYVRPIDFEAGRVDMSHGAGGRAMAQLVDELFLAAFDNEWLRQLDDQARFAVPLGRMAMATDSHVVSPLFFPGGDIGSLSVHGTINDVAMSGAKPLYLSATFILEEGFPVFCAHTTPEDSTWRWELEATQVPITVGSVRIEPGDWIVGDDDGVVVVPQAVAESVLSEAERKETPAGSVIVSVAAGTAAGPAFATWAV